MEIAMKLMYLLLLFRLTLSQHNPHFWKNHTGIVHLFEWKWNDIANECEEFLAPRGYGGVQVSPPNENAIILNRPWWERYQPVSYKIATRSGTESEFLSMTRRCNAVGVRIYVDIILNHMAADHDNCHGTGGSTANPNNLDFPAVPYNKQDFNAPCSINDWNDPWQIRNCELVGLHDLNQAVPWVRKQMISYLNNLIELGVAGFRVDAAKHMWPEDLETIFNELNDLNTEFGFIASSRPFIYQEVIDYGGESVSKFEYVEFGAVTEFRYSMEIGRAFTGHNALKYLKTWGRQWGFAKSEQSLVFVDNHDNQRSGDSNILTYKNPQKYKMAVAFMLAHPHGHPRVMSSFSFDKSDQGPPQDTQGNIIGRSINDDGSCGNGWVCEHRWRQIANMIGFRNAVKDSPINDWVDNEGSQISFCRGTHGFIAFNNEEGTFNNISQKCLPPGNYCDIISGDVQNDQCSGAMIHVFPNWTAILTKWTKGMDNVIAFHIGPQSRLAL